MNEYDNSELATFLKAIKDIADLPEEAFAQNEVKTAFNNILTPEMREQSINQIVQNFELQRTSKTEAINAMNALKDLLNELVYDTEYSEAKKAAIDNTMNSIYSIFDEAVERYHNYNIILPIMLEEGAQEPTYAHETDAAADLYAIEDQLIAPCSYGNKIRTGIKIQLPEGWLAMILPRSSIGAKTPLRLSNSIGLIDSGYRGELGVLYDNTSNEEYKIVAGDRIAQLLIMPSYRFKAQIVDTLEESDRNEGGFGSTGV